MRLPERLPQLGDGVLRTYQALWVLSAILAIISATFAAYRWERHDQVRALATYDAGLLPGSDYADGTHVIAFSPQAHAANIVDDAVVRINGRRAPLTEEGVAPLLGGPDGSDVRLTLRAPDGRVRDVVLTRSSRYLDDAYAGTGINWTIRRWIEFAINGVANLLGIAVATLLFARRPRDPVAALLALGMVMSVITPVPLAGAALAGAATALGAAAATMILLGILFFPDGRFAPRWWPIAIAVVVLNALVRLVASWNVVAREAAPYLLLATVILCVAAVVGRYRDASAGIPRQQLKFAMLGFVGAALFVCLALILNYAVLHSANEGTRAWLILLRSFANALISISAAGGLLVALLRYRLYDADSIIGRSAAYGLLTVSLIGLFAAAEKLAELFGERYFEHSIGVAAGAVGAAVAAVCIVPLHNRVHLWAERRFQKPLIKMREGLPECVADLRESVPTEQLVAAVMSRVESGVRTTREAVLLEGAGHLTLAGARNIAPGAVEEWRSGWAPASGDQALDCDRHDPTFPLRVWLSVDTGDAPETIGWLLIGPRPDGTLPGRDEREALEHVAGPVARAIHIAQLRERRDEQAEKRIGRVEAMVARLIDKLSPDATAA